MTTYQETSGRYRATSDARERFEELAVRDVSARAFMALAARGDYDPRIHGDVGVFESLTVTEHLELLAAGELLARYHRHPAHAHRALQAGATWEQVAAATGRDELKRGGTTASGPRTSIACGRTTTESWASTPPNMLLRSRELTRWRTNDQHAPPSPDGRAAPFL